ncbi:MAG: hypothetical protein KIH10_16000 [Candidatus Freyarchaeota archaeon]|nr:hypothetical protein [Candidatus Jordarchaeia archaeon]
MGKILAFLVGTIGLSLLLLVSVLWLFDSITTMMKKAGVFLQCLPAIQEGLVIIVLAMLAAVGTLVVLSLWGGK